MPGRVVPEIARGLLALRQALADLPGVAASPAALDEARFLLETKERDFVEALARSVGLQVDALSDQETLAPGESATVTVQAFVADRDRVELGAPALRSRGGFEIAPAPTPSPTPLTRRRRSEAPDLAATFRVTAAADAPPTVPYWLERPRKGNAYDWPKDDRRASPSAPLSSRRRFPPRWRERRSSCASPFATAWRTRYGASCAAPSTSYPCSPCRSPTTS